VHVIQVFGLVFVVDEDGLGSKRRIFFPDGASLYASVPPPGPVPMMMMS
jgi:hypothetical protein